MGIVGKGAGEKNGASFFSPGSPVLGSLSPTQTSEPARRLVARRKNLVAKKCYQKFSLAAKH